MKLFFITLVTITLFALTPSSIFAHAGRTDSSGGHNCNTGPCAGTYHYHWGNDKTTEHDHPEGYVAPAPTPAPTPSPPPPPAPKPEVLSTTTKTVTEEEVIKFTSTTEDTSELLVGESEVKQEGKNGVKTITYKVTYLGETETGREKTGEEVTTAPINEIVYIGTKAAVEETPPETANEEPEADPTAFDYIVTLAVFGGMGYGGYKGFKRLSKPN